MLRASNSSAGTYDSAVSPPTPSTFTFLVDVGVWIDLYRPHVHKRPGLDDRASDAHHPEAGDEGLRNAAAIDHDVRAPSAAVLADAGDHLSLVEVGDQAQRRAEPAGQVHT